MSVGSLSTANALPCGSGSTRKNRLGGVRNSALFHIRPCAKNNRLPLFLWGSGLSPEKAVRRARHSRLTKWRSLGKAAKLRPASVRVSRASPDADPVDPR